MTTAALITYFLYRCTSGLDNGLYYAKGKREYPIKLATVHGTEVINTSLVTICLFLAGMDIIQLGALALGAGIFFKGFINLGTGRPFIDPEETTDVDQDGEPGWSLWGINIPHLFAGYYRIVALLLGLSLAATWPSLSSMIGLPYPIDATLVIDTIGRIL